MPKKKITVNASTALPPTGLLCELLAYPERARIRTRRPRFGWIVNDEAPNGRQNGYQILVASTLTALALDEGDLWDSGQVGTIPDGSPAECSLNVPYEGKPLASNSTFCWKVRTWNGTGAPSRYSEPQTVHTGELTDEYTTARYPLEKHEIAPTEIVRTDSETTFVDFGRSAFGTVCLTLDNPGEEKDIEVCLGEVVCEAHVLEEEPGGSRRFKSLPLHLKKGRHTYDIKLPEDEWRNGLNGTILMPKEIGQVMPFRYCEIRGYAGPIERADIRQVAVFYPFEESTAHFVSSDRVLNEVWELCKFSMKATTFCGVYVDGDRERIPYEADAYINQLGHYCCDREFTLARHSHEHLITHPTWPTEWLLHSVLMAWADYMHTGDAASLKHYYEDLKAKALTALAREDGLISVADGRVTEDILKAVHFDGNVKDLVDWPPSERDGYDMRPINTVVNALHFHAVEMLAQIAQTLKKADDELSFRKRAALIRNAIQTKLFDASRGLFIDGEGSTHASQHANLFPAAFGLVPERHLRTVMDFIKGRGMACSVYAAQYLMEALYNAHEAEHALSLLTSTEERSWYHMIEVGSTITLEAWDNRFKPNQDWNHAWGGVPANIIPRGLMGVRPLSPGFEKILIQPQPGSLSFAEMRLPTIRGTVSVRFNNEPHCSFDLEIELPTNMTACIGLPDLGAERPEVTLDGNRINGSLKDGFVFVNEVRSGKHRLIANA